jgi:hypothetical protein
MAELSMGPMPDHVTAMARCQHASLPELRQPAAACGGRWNASRKSHSNDGLFRTSAPRSKEGHFLVARADVAKVLALATPCKRVDHLSNLLDVSD